MNPSSIDLTAFNTFGFAVSASQYVPVHSARALQNYFKAAPDAQVDEVFAALGWFHK